MKYSELALITLAIKESTKITNAKFNKQFYNVKALTEYSSEPSYKLEEKYAALLDKFREERIDGFICPFDDEFPELPDLACDGDKPFLIFYRGDIKLLSDKKNIAVIGTTDIDDSITKREKEVVDTLVESKFNIVSGLAKGCDTAAHRICLEDNGKTIAVLPCEIGNIFPKDNVGLSEEIVKGGGLLVTEYYKPAISRFESTSRFVNRDKLQAMFSCAVVMIASYRPGEGDSGSKYAMEAARKYGIDRFIMFNPTEDKYNPAFGLNKDMQESNRDIKVIDTDFKKNLNRLKQSILNNEKYNQLTLDVFGEAPITYVSQDKIK